MRRLLPAFLLPLVFAAFIPAAALAATVTINWSAVTTYTDGNAIPTTVAVTYNVYGAACTAGMTCSLVVLQSADRYDSAVISNVTPGYYCYAITAVANGIESPQSSPQTCVMVSETPTTPTVMSATVGP